MDKPPVIKTVKSWLGNAIKNTVREVAPIVKDIKPFSRDLRIYTSNRIKNFLEKVFFGKGVLVNTLYKKRGKYTRPLIHMGMSGLAGLSIVIAPIVAQEFPGRSVDPWTIPQSVTSVSASTQEAQIATNFSEDVRGEIVEYVVQKGDNINSIAQKFGVSSDTIRWQNNLTAQGVIKEGQTLQVLPITGVAHSVKKGDTVYSIAKKYDIDPQGIVNYPFNSFSNDETFQLAIGQVVIVPDGVKPAEAILIPSVRIRQSTPDAGTIAGMGVFVWPVSGTITQRFVWYHKGLDVANRAAPDILAADSGRVLIAGWPDNTGYGNRVILDHGNGYKTLYGHMQKIYVLPGQGVTRGSPIGKMGSTGKSTGTHLHFEVILNGVYLNPLSVL
jgi:murein DD-endopeptidase MepM/ murein hydrolase activator NlpD